MQEKIFALLEKYVDVEEDFSNFKREVIQDFITAIISREVSYIARKEVLTGKAKFGVTGDGKELLQLAMSKVFKKGDWLAGYYRDQTFMLAKGLMSVEDYFSQIYADCNNDPFSGGRQMNNHFATKIYDEAGEWLDLKNTYNVSSVMSCTAGAAGRALGHAYASKVFRSWNEPSLDKFSNNGDEVCFMAIGDGSTSEGPFWEMMNASGVLDVPLVVVIYDDGYAISVPIEYQTTKSSISKALEGLLIDEDGNGIHIIVAKAWDYQELCVAFEKAAGLARKKHKTVLLHIQECTQPQGHSTSGSHERYKSKERLDWEKEYDCNFKMEAWLISNGFLSEDDVISIHDEARSYVKDSVKAAWVKFEDPILEELDKFKNIISDMPAEFLRFPMIEELLMEMKKLIHPFNSEIHSLARRMKFVLQHEGLDSEALNTFIGEKEIKAHMDYHNKLYSETPYSAINQIPVKPIYSESSKMRTGHQIINKFFESAFHKRKDLIAFGEDLGKIGDVNQGFAGLQEIFGEKRIMDTGIREWTLVGQAMGMSMRGLKPIVDIQYLDYLAYAFSPLSDDVATLRYRTDGIQRCPMIVRTRGHRLEGIWHSGSPMGMMITSMKGIHLCVPYSFVQAAGLYNTLLDSDEPGIVIECLNAYRLKEKQPDNLTEIKIPLGVPDVLLEGKDITLVTYGACVRIVMKAAESLAKFGISCEVIDVQTLMPFDIEHLISFSIRKTNKVLFIDEDVPGGATAYMYREVIEGQNAYKFLDAPAKCLSSKEHRTPYGSDGDYYTKPNVDSVFETVYNMMKEYNPSQYK